MANGLGNVCGRKNGERNLVEKWLESVVIAAIDEGHVYRHVRQRHTGAQARETAADDHHPGTPSLHHCRDLCHSVILPL